MMDRTLPIFTDPEFRSMLNWFMASDPWPADASDKRSVRFLLNKEARVRGFDGWTDAYHNFTDDVHEPRGDWR